MSLSAEKPLVSVIIPAYNAERFLMTTLDSVFAQTYSNLQVIVINDASTDSTAEVLKNCSDPRLQIISLKCNRHAAYARNAALPFVKGEYIAYLDSDDLWHPEKIEKQIYFLEEHPQYGACFTWASIIDENGEPRAIDDPDSIWLHRAFHQPHRMQKEHLLHMLTKGNFLSSSSSVIRSKIIHEIGGQNVSLVQLHDFEHWIRLLSKYDIYILCEELTAYRRIVDGASISSVSSMVKIRTYNEDVFICNHFFDHFSDTRFYELFHDIFRNPNAHSHDELKCEKAFLLEKAYCGTEAYVNNIQTLLSTPETADLLLHQYNLSPKDFYIMNVTPRFVSEDIRLYIQNLYQDNNALKRTLITMQNSRRWILASKIAKIFRRFFP